MKNRDILNAMGDIDFDMIEDAGRVTRKTSLRRKVARWSSLAACVCLIFVGVAMIFKPDVSQPGVSPDCEAYGAFSLDDFYTFAATGSRNPAHYASDKLKVNDTLRVSASVDASALLKIEEIFNNNQLDSEVRVVHIHDENFYSYVFNNGMLVSVKCNVASNSTVGSIRTSDINAHKETNYITESETNKFSASVPVDTVYVKTIDDISISRQKVKSYKTEYFRFTAYIDAFEITIDAYWGADNSYSSLEEWMNDPKNQSVMAFFDDEKLPEAIANLKTAVEAAQRRK